MNINDPTVQLFHTPFNVSLPSIYMYTTDEIELYGTPTSGNKGIDEMMMNAPVYTYMTIPQMAEKYDEMGYSRRVLSRNAEIGGTLTAGMIPWSDNGIYMATILGVATFEYLPYMWLSFSCIALAIIFGFTGLFMWKNKNAV